MFTIEDKKLFDEGLPAELIWAASQIERGNLPVWLHDSKTGQDKDIDFVLVVNGLNKPVHQWTVDDILYCEIKQDRWTKKTGNVFLEFEVIRDNGRRELGWTQKTKADRVYNYVCGDGMFNVLEVEKLKEFYNKFFWCNELDNLDFADLDDFPSYFLDSLKFTQRTMKADENRIGDSVRRHWKFNIDANFMRACLGNFETLKISAEVQQIAYYDRYFKKEETRNKIIDYIVSNYQIKTMGNEFTGDKCHDLHTLQDMLGGDLYGAKA